MRFFIIFFLFIFSYSCNTKNFNTAYKDYYKYQKLYINAILDDNKAKKIRYLKKLIECGEYLHFDVKRFKEKLKKLSPPKKTYVKILSQNPLKIKTSNHYRIYDLKHKKLHTKVIDIFNAIFPKRLFKKRYKDVVVKISQYNKSIVRVVLYSKKPIKANIKKLKSIFAIEFQKSPSFSNLVKKQKIIVIDPGHGGKDSGGVGIGKRKEKIAVLKIAKYLKSYLQKAGYKVYLTRNRDIFRTLKWRTHFANQKKADLFISIHCNIAPKHIKYPKGIETYYLSPARSERAMRVAKIENKELTKLNSLDQRVILKFLNKERIIASTKFAIDVQRGMLNNLKKHFKSIEDGGVKPAPFWVLVGTQMPAILIETGYLTNPMEAKRLFNPTYQRYLAQGIAKGVKEYFRKNP